MTDSQWLRSTASGVGKALLSAYCYPVPVEEWPEHPEIIERMLPQSCARTHHTASVCRSACPDAGSCVESPQEADVGLRASVEPLSGDTELEKLTRSIWPPFAH